MSQSQTYVGLDIGTTSVKVVVAEYANQRLNVIGTGSERSDGLNRGVIVDIDKTVQAITRAIQEAEQKANVTIDHVVVGVPGNQISIEPCYGMIAVNNEDHEITDKEIRDVLAAARVRSIPQDREVISIIPEEFVVDGFPGIQDPRGMTGVRLELYADMITGPKTIIHNIRLCVERAGLTISNLVVQPLADASIAMTADEREVGTIMINMGGGQTTASVIHDNQLKFAYVDQEGGVNVTRDIATVLNTGVENAERLKREYGYAKSEDTSPKESFPVEMIGKREAEQSDEHYLSEIIEARLQQTFEALKEPLDQVEAFDLPGGFIITGGASLLPGTMDLVEEVFDHEATLYIPDQVGLRTPAFTTAYGLVAYACRMPDIYLMTEQPTNATIRTRSKAQVSAKPRTTQSTSRAAQPRQETMASEPAQTKPENLEPVSPSPEASDEESEGVWDHIKQMFNDMFS
ncbi:MAG: cell division protein FtsA [Aerococcus sp.]|nr:cell division protein FtsA [Aerococcus sp.]